MHISTLTLLLTLANLITSQATPPKKIYQGFNSGSTLTNRKAKTESDFTAEFKSAQSLLYSPGYFSSVRLYTNIQASTTTDPISAFPAAIATNTTILLGIWCSGTTTIANELTALKSAVEKYGAKLTDLIMGISVGSEDLYRDSVSGRKNKAGLGKGPDEIVDFITEVRKTLTTDAGLAALSKIPIGHVDSWSAWTNSSNEDVVKEVDFVGVDLYPYYEDNLDNTISNSKSIFDELLTNVTKAVGKKEIWITETGWPVSGPAFGKAEASIDNAHQYWGKVGCGELFGRKNVWWYNLRDSNPDNDAKFAISADLNAKTAYNLSCPATLGAPASVNLEEKKGAGVRSVGYSMTSFVAAVGAVAFVLM